MYSPPKFASMMWICLFKEAHICFIIFCAEFDVDLVGGIFFFVFYILHFQCLQSEWAWHMGNNLSFR